nr:MAG TPA: hypothetical protein [Caudoviricetes sp.]
MAEINRRRKTRDNPKRRSRPHRPETLWRRLLRRIFAGAARPPRHGSI